VPRLAGRGTIKKMFPSREAPTCLSRPNGIAEELQYKKKEVVCQATVHKKWGAFSSEPGGESKWITLKALNALK
jgi:hypothetical protein